VSLCSTSGYESLNPFGFIIMGAEAHFFRLGSGCYAKKPGPFGPGFFEAAVGAFEGGSINPGANVSAAPPGRTGRGGPDRGLTPPANFGQALRANFRYASAASAAWAAARRATGTRKGEQLT
jgi:hypothetical protein